MVALLLEFRGLGAKLTSAHSKKEEGPRLPGSSGQAAPPLRHHAQEWGNSTAHTGRGSGTINPSITPQFPISAPIFPTQKPLNSNVITAERRPGGTRPRPRELEKRRGHLVCPESLGKNCGRKQLGDDTRHSGFSISQKTPTPDSILDKMPITTSSPPPTTPQTARYSSCASPPSSPSSP